MTPTTWIGVDIAKADFVAAQRTQKGFDTQNFPMTRQGFEAFRDCLKHELHTVDHQAQALVRQDTTLRPAYRLLLSIPGIGPKTALTLLAEYGPQLHQATPRQLTCYAGLDPILFESGTSVRKRPHVSKQGNWRLRRALYMAALVGVRFNPVLKTFYQRKLKQGLAKKSALGAAMRKLLHLVYGVLKHQQPFNPDYESLT